MSVAKRRSSIGFVSDDEMWSFTASESESDPEPCPKGKKMPCKSWAAQDSDSDSDVDDYLDAFLKRQAEREKKKATKSLTPAVGGDPANALANLSSSPLLQRRRGRISSPSSTSSTSLSAGSE